MYLIHNEGKSAVAVRFIRTLQNKIYKYMTLYTIIFDKYNSTYYSTIKMKTVDVKSSIYIDINKENE